MKTSAEIVAGLSRKQIETMNRESARHYGMRYARCAPGARRLPQRDRGGDYRPRAHAADIDPLRAFHGGARGAGRLKAAKSIETRATYRAVVDELSLAGMADVVRAPENATVRAALRHLEAPSARAVVVMQYKFAAFVKFLRRNPATVAEWLTLPWAPDQ